MDYSNPGETKWNIDDARMRALESYLELTEEAFLRWDINKINLYLRAVLRVIIGTGKDKDDKVLKDKRNELELIKRGMDDATDITKKYQKKLEFYNKAEELLELINKQNANSGIYFRKGKDPTKAAVDM